MAVERFEDLTLKRFQGIIKGILSEQDKSMFDDDLEQCAITASGIFARRTRATRKDAAEEAIAIFSGYIMDNSDIRFILDTILKGPAQGPVFEVVKEN